MKSLCRLVSLLLIPTFMVEPGTAAAFTVPSRPAIQTSSADAFHSQALVALLAASIYLGAAIQDRPTFAVLSKQFSYAAQRWGAVRRRRQGLPNFRIVKMEPADYHPFADALSKAMPATQGAPENELKRRRSTRAFLSLIQAHLVDVVLGRGPELAAVFAVYSALHPGEALGGLILAKYPQGTAKPDYLEGILAVEFGSQNQGIGSALWHAAFEWMIQNRFRMFHGTIRRDNLPGIRALEKAAQRIGVVVELDRFKPQGNMDHHWVRLPERRVNAMPVLTESQARAFLELESVPVAAYVKQTADRELPAIEFVRLPFRQKSRRQANAIHFDLDQIQDLTELRDEWRKQIRYWIHRDVAEPQTLRLFLNDAVLQALPWDTWPARNTTEPLGVLIQKSRLIESMPSYYEMYEAEKLLVPAEASPDHRVLELGMGWGNFSFLLMAMGYKHIVGVELCPRFLKLAQPLARKYRAMQKLFGERKTHPMEEPFYTHIGPAIPIYEFWLPKYPRPATENQIEINRFFRMIREDRRLITAVSKSKLILLCDIFVEHGFTGVSIEFSARARRAIRKQGPLANILALWYEPGTEVLHAVLESEVIRTVMIEPADLIARYEPWMQGKTAENTEKARVQDGMLEALSVFPPHWGASMEDLIGSLPDTIVFQIQKGLDHVEIQSEISYALTKIYWPDSRLPRENDELSRLRFKASMISELLHLFHPYDQDPDVEPRSLYFFTASEGVRRALQTFGDASGFALRVVEVLERFTKDHPEFEQLSFMEQAHLLWPSEPGKEPRYIDQIFEDLWDVLTHRVLEMPDGKLVVRKLHPMGEMNPHAVRLNPEKARRLQSAA